MTTLDSLINQVHCMSALDLLAMLPDGCMDLILTDPPYGIGYASSWTTRNDGKKRDTSGTFGADELDTSWVKDTARVLKDGGAMYMFTRWDVAHHWHKAIDSAGLKTVQRIVWYKAHWKMGDLRYYGSQTEDILFARKGDHEMRWSKREGNVWYSASALYQGDGYWEHPTQKPLKILRKAILNSSSRGDLVLDLFSGSGSTLEAAKLEGRNYIGCDINSDYVTTARLRLAQPFTPLFPLFFEA